MPFNNDNTKFEEYAKYHNETDWQKDVLNSCTPLLLCVREAKPAINTGYRGVITAFALANFIPAPPVPKNIQPHPTGLTCAKIPAPNMRRIYVTAP